MTNTIQHSAFDTAVRNAQENPQAMASVYKVFLATEFFMWVANPKETNADVQEQFAFNLVGINGNPSIIISETGEYISGYAGKKINLVKGSGKDLVSVTHEDVGITVLLHNGSGFSLTAQVVQELKNSL